MVIYLGLQLLVASSDLPEGGNDPGRFAVPRAGRQVSRHAELPLCLILLRAGFTKPAASPRLLVSSYLTVSPLPRTDRSQPFGGMLSVALSLTLQLVGVTDRPALRSPDFPLLLPLFTSSSAATI